MTDEDYEAVLWTFVWTPNASYPIPVEGERISTGFDVEGVIRWCDLLPDGRYSVGAVIAREDKERVMAYVGEDRMFKPGRVRKARIGWWVDGHWCPTRKIRDRAMAKVRRDV